METEQPQSTFRKTSSTAIIQTSQAFDVSDKQNYGADVTTDRSGEIFKRLMFKFYQQLDSLCGTPSYFLLNRPDDFFDHPWQEIFRMLLSKNLIDDFFPVNMRYNDCPFFYRIDLVPHYESGSTDGKKMESAFGHGFDKNAETAFLKAIGEFFERYFLTLYHRKDLLRSSQKALQKKKNLVADLNLFAGFSDEQKKLFPRRQFNEDSIFYWGKAKRWSTGETVYLPAQFLYWNYTRGEGEPSLCEGNTNGAGGFSTQEGAILAGLYELIQRDSFLIYWLNRLTPRLIDPHTIPNEDFKNLLEESERYGFKIYCLNITTDIKVPSFAVIISDSSGIGPRFCLGAGCQADPLKALYRALQEAWSVYYWMRYRPPYPALDRNFEPFQEKIRQDERLRLWSNPEMARHLEFFISGKRESFAEISFDYPEKFESSKKELDFLVNRLENMGPGYEVYYYQASHQILSQVGYYAVQVIVPQLLSLYLAEFNAPLGSSRIKKVPEKMGFSPSQEINPLPHLFP